MFRTYYIISLIYVDIMKSQQTLTFENRHHMPSNIQYDASNSHLSLFHSSTPTFPSNLDRESRDQTLNSQKIPTKYWNQIQQQLFHQFWLQTFIENPCQNFSLDAPLIRKSYNKALSDYIKKRGKALNIQCQKSPIQCKSKFGTIRRRIQRQRKNAVNKQSIDFIDFIIQRAEKKVTQWTGIRDKIQKVKELRSNQSPFTKIIIEEYRFQKSIQYQDTFSSILKCIAKSQQSSIDGFSQ